MTSTHRGETEAVARTMGAPATVASLARDLRHLGPIEGATVLVHSSLSALGWVVGGAEAVVLALEEAVGPEGTLVMPAYSMNAPEPSLWTNPAVPESWWGTIRSEWPPFDPHLSPAVRLGVIAETFRSQHGTSRSFHPNHSFSARGPNARRLLEGHSLDESLGEGSPLARLYDLSGWILLLGVDHSSNSSFHLAEYRAAWPGKHSRRPIRARLVRDRSVEEVVIQELDLDSEDFANLGDDFDREPGAVRTGLVAFAETRLMEQRAAVDFAVRWIERCRR
jgi:aminoglycoside 3-N-acetyltransferase